jgi:uncharacterized iron-regulated membrane protein
MMSRRVRRFFFWCHLTAGCAAGIVILLMLLTGVLPTYERQILASAARSQQLPPQTGASPRAFNELIAASLRSGIAEPASILMYRDAAQPVEFRSGRQSVLVDRYTGKSLGESAPRLHAFFQSVLALHRWVGMTGERNGKSHYRSLQLCVLLSSGDGRLSLVAKEMDATAPAPNHVVSPPRLRPRARCKLAHRNRLLVRDSPSGSCRDGNREKQVPNWQIISLQMPRHAHRPFTLSVDSGSGGRPDLRSELIIDRNGSVVRASIFASYSLGRRLRSWVRFSHTGKAGGLWGQTIAGLASASGMLLVFTGLALAIRRFHFWRRRKRQQSCEQKAELNAVTLPYLRPILQMRLTPTLQS